jgi:hypothetical protein
MAPRIIGCLDVDLFDLDGRRELLRKARRTADDLVRLHYGFDNPSRFELLFRV